MTNLNAAYIEASDALTKVHAEIRALTANKNKTVESVKAAYDRFDAVTAAFNAAKDSLNEEEAAA